MKDMKDYADYESYFKDDLVVAVRKLLKRIEDKGDLNLEDSEEHNALVRHFNRFALHKKISKSNFLTWSITE